MNPTHAMESLSTAKSALANYGNECHLNKYKSNQTCARKDAAHIKKTKNNNNSKHTLFNKQQDWRKCYSPKFKNRLDNICHCTKSKRKQFPQRNQGKDWFTHNPFKKDTAD